MRVELYAPPWGTSQVTSEAGQAISILGAGLFEDTVAAYEALCAERRASGKRVPKGMQSTMNRLVDERFGEAGWQGRHGQFRKGATWVRVTFRHQMSQGSDILDALKACTTGGCELAMIVCGDKRMLKRLAPSEGNSMVSFERLKGELEELDGVLSFPIMAGGLVLA